MKQPSRLKSGDKLAIVSLSAGILGEAFVAHELQLGQTQLARLGLVPTYMPNAKRGIEFIKNNPKARAQDLKDAFADPSIKGIICAIGGDDTYKTIPFLLGDPKFAKLVQANPKPFIGFSDSTINHLTLYKLGLMTYYGQAYLTDLAELSGQMLPYSQTYFEQLIEPEPKVDISSSPIWHPNRSSFGPEQVGVAPINKSETSGHLALRGQGKVSGQLLGGCLDSIYEALAGNRYADQPAIIQKYAVFPSPNEWRGKILFAETSEEMPDPERVAKMLTTLDDHKVLENVNGIIVGKPMNEAHFKPYQKLWLEATKKYQTPILYNLNFGHGAPRAILPYGANATIDFAALSLTIDQPFVK